MKNDKLISNEEQKENKSKFFKYFIRIFVVLILIYVFVAVVAILRNDSSSKNIKTAKTPITKEILANIIKNNLKIASPEIENKFLLLWEDIDKNIDDNIDDLFKKIVDENLDKYLDLHYSFLGSHFELGILAFGDYNTFINKKLFGEDFNSKVEEVKNKIDSFYQKKEQENLDFIKNKALAGVDLESNKNELNQINTLIQEEKNKLLGKIIGSSVTTGLGVAIAIKISAKVASKVAAKTGVKMATKIAASGTSATAGISCGPFVWICSSALAVGTYVATDIAVNTGDEFFSRDELKKDILEIINEEKENIKNEYKHIYKNNLEELSEQYKNILQNADSLRYGNNFR
ncbi:hypothetical protein [Aliarcobacter butzleri]|uniref:hypothetical protein n=1 Tax=Aliarcobacter butzleri TaxID=28197 RepID=UPI002B252102|nr:hypothetical protein [Aliarcobacter butzleri]